MNRHARYAVTDYDRGSLKPERSHNMNVSTMTARLRTAADAFIAATNAGDVEGVLKLFALDAVIDDPSTGQRFDGHAGIRHYVEQFFIGYHTVTRFLSIESLGAHRALVRVDFTGDFGHEIGLLELTMNAEGILVRIDADLE